MKACPAVCIITVNSFGEANANKQVGQEGEVFS